MAIEIGDGTMQAARAARDALVAGAQPADERRMATIARRALFDEALLGALKARVAEWKAIAK